ncbi:MAG: patatin-like phospholipase family protein [Cytophagaceae bacterium]|nr:patatin-like phospholipase family protein [Cytophagaceae bacterium]
MERLIRILSIDGGGIRGIIPGQILIQLEKIIQKKTGNPDARIADYFDFFAGTSTGGILTCILLCPDEKSRPLFTAEQAVNLYLQKGGAIFKRTALKNFLSLGGLSDEKYNEDALEKSLNEYFKTTKLSQLLKPCLIPAYEIDRRYAHFFTQHDAQTKPGYDFLIKDVARATSAAPTYFEAAKIKSTSEVAYTLVDGGVFANNPAMCAFCEVSDLFKKDKPLPIENMLMLSLGTGNVKKPYAYNAAKNWGAIGWVRPVIDIMMSGVSETVEYQLGKLFDSQGRKDQYLRINPDLGHANSDMDDASLKNLNALKEAGIYCSEKYYDELARMADLLIGQESQALPDTLKV